MSGAGNTLALYAMTVGLLDSGTGALLVAAPSFALRLMFIEQAPLDPVWLRFIGAFVAGVGLIYCYPLFTGAVRRALLLPAALELTVIPRASVGLFVAAAVAYGVLAPAWLTVAVTDLGLAVLQIAWIRRDSRAVAST